MKKTTKATLKSFIKKNSGNLMINVTSEFDGMIDGCRMIKTGFEPIKTIEFCENRLGIAGVYVVGGSRNHFTAYDDGIYSGIECSNCCGRFILAVKKA